MRRRENFAEQTKASDPVGYRTAHDPLSVFRQEQRELRQEKGTPGVCRKCGKKIGRGLAMHEKHCHVG